MKKILTIIAALAISTGVYATGSGGGYSSAGSASGAGAATGAAAGGYTYGNEGYSGSGQFSAAGAQNETGAGSYNDAGRRGGSRSVGSEAHSTGSSYSYSSGETVGPNAAGITGGIAAQAGIAGAEAGGLVRSRTGIGVVGTKSGAAAGSISATANVDDGEAYNDAWSYASSTNDASLSIRNGVASHDVSSTAGAGGGSGGEAVDAVQVGAGGGIAGGYTYSGAFTWGGGYSGDNGNNGDGGDGDGDGGCEGNCGNGNGNGGGNGTGNEGNGQGPQ